MLNLESIANKMSNMTVYGQRIRSVITMPLPVAAHIARISGESQVSASSAVVRCITAATNDIYFLMQKEIEVQCVPGLLSEGCSRSAALERLNNNYNKYQLVIIVNPLRRSIMMKHPHQLLAQGD